MPRRPYRIRDVFVKGPVTTVTNDDQESIVGGHPIGAACAHDAKHPAGHDLTAILSRLTTRDPMHEYANGTSKSSQEKSVKVLLVEDSAVLAEVLSGALAEIPEVELVGVVDSEAEAFKIIAGGRVDLLFLDLQLKQGTGFGILRSLATMHPAPRSVVLTNHDLPEYHAAAMALGATYFLDKARDFHRLPEIVRAIISVIAVE